MESAVKYRKEKLKAEMTTEIKNKPKISNESFSFCGCFGRRDLIDIVSLSPCGLDVFWIFGAVSKLLAQILDMHHHGAVTDGVVFPDTLLDVVD